MTKTGQVVKPQARTLTQIVSDATDVSELMRAHNLIKLRAASVGDFDFKADFHAYKYFVESRLEDLRKIVNARLKAVGDVAKKKLGEAALAKAKKRYESNYIRYAKKITGGNESPPKHAMKIRSGVVYFSDNPDTQPMLLKPKTAPFDDEPKQPRKKAEPKTQAKPVRKPAKKKIQPKVRKKSKKF